MPDSAVFTISGREDHIDFRYRHSVYNARCPHADFFLVFTRDAQNSFVKVEEVKFISGSEDLKSANTTWKNLISKVAIPGDGHPHILRRGTLGCYPDSGCSFTLFLPRDVHSLN